MSILTIEPSKTNPQVYSRIWNTIREDSRFPDANICHFCRHQIMLYPTDYKRIVSKVRGNKHKHNTIYYHGEPCHACGMTCGDIFENDSRPRQEVKLI